MIVGRSEDVQIQATAGGRAGGSRDSDGAPVDRFGRFDIVVNF